MRCGSRRWAEILVQSSSSLMVPLKLAPVQLEIVFHRRTGTSQLRVTKRKVQVRGDRAECGAAGGGGPRRAAAASHGAEGRGQAERKRARAAGRNRPASGAAAGARSGGGRAGSHLKGARGVGELRAVGGRHGGSAREAYI